MIRLSGGLGSVFKYGYYVGLKAKGVH